MMSRSLRSLQHLALLAIACTGAMHSAHAAPVVSWNAPANNAKFLPNTPIVLTVNASDSSDTISKVDFYRDGTTLIGSASAAPYTITWSNAAAGKYRLTAKATNSSNIAKTSGARNIIVNTPPTIDISSPTADTSYLGLATVTISAAVSDADNNLSKVDFYRGGTLIGTATSAPYTVTWNDAPPGNYKLSAKATDSLGAVTKSASVAISITNPISIAISAPANRAKYASPGTVTLTATASNAHSNATITQVDYYAGTTFIGNATEAPYTFDWDNVPAGKYSIKATATDSQGLTKTSSAINITVDNAPTITLSAPANNASYAIGATIPMTAVATDADGSIANVKFYAGGTLLSTVTAAPFTYSWPNVAQGKYSLKAIATDNLGMKATSASVIVYVGVNVPPTVGITAPSNDSTFAAPAAITLSATASDSDGSIAKVRFFKGSTLLGTVTSAPYTFNWNNVAAGTYSITAKATDNSNATTTSAAISLTVTETSDTLPTVTLTAPASNASFTAPATIDLSADADVSSGSNGSIVRVDFYQGTTLLGTATSAPYSFSWVDVAAGTYSFTAKATDSSNQSKTSVPVQVTVAGGGVQAYYIYSDQLNTPRLIKDQNNNTVWQWDNNDPFGSNVANEAPGGSAVPFTFNPRFPGQYFDKETNLHYNYFRDYDPQTGRYVQSDPIGLAAGPNTYTYVEGNPVSGIDSLGLWGSQGGIFIHQRAIYNNVPLGMNDIFTLYEATKFADSAQFQTGEYAFRHAMFNPSSDKSRRRACFKARRYVEDQYRKGWEAEAAGSRDSGMFAFGMALHTMQDSTSPAHSGFQEWTGNESIIEEIAHINKEKSYPNGPSSLDEITRQSWNWYSKKQLPPKSALNCECIND